MSTLNDHLQRDMELTEGARYTSFSDLEDAIAKFSQETNSVYTVYNSKSIEAENRNRPPEKHLPSCLKYRAIKFACKHYGATRSKSKGLRPNQSSFKIGCPSFIYAAAHGNELIVEKIEKNHSHTCDPELVNFYPERRSLAHLGNDRKDNKNPETTLLKTVRDDVLDLLCIGVDRRRIRNYVHIRTKRLLWTGDLNNLAKQAREQKRFVSQERSSQLLNQLKTLESKENVPQISVPGNMKEKLNSLKRKVPSDPRTLAYDSMKSETEDKGSDEHCYSVPTNSNKKKRILRDECADAEQEQDSSEMTNWDQQNLEEVVKSILGPSQDGPFIVYLNNDDGVAVVEVSDGHGATDNAQHSNALKIERNVEEASSNNPDEPEESNDQFSSKEDDSIPDVSVNPPECHLGANDDDEQVTTSPASKGVLQKLASSKKTFFIRRICSPTKQATTSKTSQPGTITVSTNPVQHNKRFQHVVKLCKKTECASETPSVQNVKNGQCVAPHSVITLSDAENEHVSDGNSDDEAYVDEEELYDSQASCASSEFERTLENEQLLLLQTKQAKLKEEKNMFKLKAQKLKLQIRSITNSLEQQSLEKEKVRLEIKLLQMQIKEKQKQL